VEDRGDRGAREATEATRAVGTSVKVDCVMGVWLEGEEI
jgi:hypothetical protein